MHPSKWLGTALILLAAGCADQISAPQSPEPGTLVVSLAATRTDVGAVLIRLEGAGVAQAEPADSAFHLFIQARDSGDATNLAVVGTALRGPLVKFTVPDTRQLEAYTATLLSMADRRNRLIDRLDGYRLTVTKR